MNKTQISAFDGVATNVGSNFENRLLVGRITYRTMCIIWEKRIHKEIIHACIEEFKNEIRKNVGYKEMHKDR